MRTLLLAAAMAFAGAAIAADPPREMTEIKAGTPVAINPAKAYLLFRTTSGVSPVFLRVPTAEETARYEEAKRAAFQKAEPGLIKARESVIAQNRALPPGAKPRPVPPVPSLDSFNFVWDGVRNAQTLNMGKALEKTGDLRTMLIEALPGDYVLYGLGYADLLQSCLCLGTVSFQAPSGTVTDLGTLLVAPAADRSDEPELAAETGFGPSMNGHLVLWAAAIRPATAATPKPAALSGTAVSPAAYRATGKFVSGFSFGVNRLAPVPGVLGYDGGNVLDLTTGKVAPNHY